MPKATVHIPQPCTQSWAAMTPTATGRHCAACQKTVIDFTEKTDAEILTFLTHAAGQACGRFGKDQLNRPLLPAADRSANRPSRWRGWLALAAAAWGLRAGPAAATEPYLATLLQATHPHKKAGPPARSTPGLVRGTVRDAATHEPLAGVAVFLKGENRYATTDANGNFSVQPLTAQRSEHTLVLHFAGYQSKTVRLLASSRQVLHLELRADPAAGVEVVGYLPIGRQEREISYGAPVLVDALPAAMPLPALPSSQPPRSIWYRLTRPFH